MKLCWKRKPKPQNNTTVPDRQGDTGVSDSILRHFYPKAQWLPDLDLLKSRHKLNLDKPEDLIILIHHTAGHQNQKASDFIKFFLRKGYCTDFMDHTGQVWQQRHGDRAGGNAGKSKFKGRSNVSKFAIAIEVASGGKLKLKLSNGQIINWNKPEIPNGARIVTYFGKSIPNARYVTTAQGYTETGWYEPFTAAQEKSLAEYIAYWISKGVPAQNVVGHDEVAGNRFLGYQRKNDPSGSLSMPLGQFVRSKVLNG